MKYCGNERLSTLTVWFLKGILALGGGFLPLGPTPTDLFATEEEKEVWDSDDLVYKGGIRLSLGNSILEMEEAARANIENVKFPFLVIHGKDNPFVPASASELLYNGAKTAKGDKVFICYETDSHLLFVSDEFWFFLGGF